MIGIKFKKPLDMGLFVLLALIALAFFYQFHRKGYFKGRSKVASQWEYLPATEDSHVPDGSAHDWMASSSPCMRDCADLLKNSPMVWLRGRLPNPLEPSHIIIRSHPGPFEVYAGNQQIYRFSNHSPDQKYSFPGFVAHRIAIDPQNAGKDVYFKIFRQDASEAGFCGPAAIELEEDKHAILNSHQDGIESVFVAVLGWLFGFFALGLLFTAPKKQRTFYGSFAGLMFALSFWIYSCVSGPLFKWPPFLSSLAWSYFDLIGLYLVPPFLIRFYCEVFDKHTSVRNKKFLLRPLIAMCYLYALHALLVFLGSLFGYIQINDTLHLFDNSAILFLVLMNINILVILASKKLFSLWGWLAASKSPEIYKIKFFSVGFFVFTVTGIHDVLVGVQSSLTSDEMHWTYIGAFALISSLSLLLIRVLFETFRETQNHKAIEETLDRSLHDAKTPATRLVELTSSLYSLVPRGEVSFEGLMQFRDLAIQRIQSAYNIALQSERTLNDTIKNRKSLESNESQNFMSVSIVEILHEQIRQSLAGFKFSGLKFTYEFEHKSQIWCDPGQIARVFSNLLSNAAKHAKGTPPRLIFRTSESGDCVCLSVINTGTPIAESECQVIFDKFYTAKTQDPTIKEGHGIGLTIVKQFTELNHGSVLCRPISQLGTEFFLTLRTRKIKDEFGTRYLFNSSNEIPQVASIILSKDTLMTQEEEGLCRQIVGVLKTLGRPFVVCLIDDEDIIGSSIESYITASDLTSSVQFVDIRDYVEGIEYVLDHEPDLVLIDLAFRKDLTAGFKVLEKLKDVSKSHKIIYTNNHVRNNELTKFFADGVSEKPMSRADLFRLILKVLERQELKKRDR